MNSFTFYSIVFLIFFHTCCNCALNIECNEKSKLKLDFMFDRLYLFGAVDRKYPTNKREMRTFCSQNTEYQIWVKEYSDKCLKGLSKQVLGLLMYSVSKNTNAMCRSVRRTNEFLKIGSCGNSAKNGTIKCYRNLFGFIDATSGHQKTKIKIPLMCCYFKSYIQCNQDVYESMSDKCDANAADGHDKLIFAFAIESIKLVCSDYFDANDKCDRLLAGPYAKNMKKTFTKSSITVVVKLLDSL